MNSVVLILTQARFRPASEQRDRNRLRARRRCTIVVSGLPAMNRPARRSQMNYVALAPKPNLSTLTCGRMKRCVIS